MVYPKIQLGLGSKKAMGVVGRGSFEGNFGEGVRGRLLEVKIGGLYASIDFQGLMWWRERSKGDPSVYFSPRVPK